MKAEIEEVDRRHRRELLLHCYRMLGSQSEAEDVVQETFVRAWRSRASLRDASRIRPWLYRVATNACLDALRSRRRRPLPSAIGGPADPSVLPRPAEGEPTWLEPLPDAAAGDDPEGDLLGRESIALAFVAALQLLPPRQRAVLLLRDVLDWPASEVATLLDTSPAAVHSAQQRARRTLEERDPEARRAPDPPETPAVIALAERYARAWEDLDMRTFVSLLRDDALLTMPPNPEWYRGARGIAELVVQRFRPTGRGPVLRPARANRQPALAAWVMTPAGLQPFGIQVLTIWRGRICRLDTFLGPEPFRRFGLVEPV